ncbi:MAG: cytochrome P450 [Cyanobacteria bacterium J06623_7]
MNSLNTPKKSALVQLINWIFRPLDFLEECAQRYGDTFQLNLLGLPPFTVVSNPLGVEEVLSVDARKFDVGRTNYLAASLLGENSLILLDGKEHRRQRKLMMPPFHGEKVKSYATTICQITDRITSQWQPGQAFKSQETMQEITLETILHVVFGLSEGDRYQQIKAPLIDYVTLTDSPLKASVIFFSPLQQDWGEWSPWGRLMGRKRQIYDLLQAEIEERRANSDWTGGDVLSLMMSATDETGEGLSDIELKDQMMTLLVAGHETTATSLAWALYWVHKLPEVKQKLLTELSSLDIDADPLGISRLPYLSAVCNETLRIYPVAVMAFLRYAKSSIEVEGNKFSTSDLLAPAIYLTHHREDIYPEPKQFKPERFLERQYSPYEFLPFGGGSRRCIGYALALLEMKLVLAKIITTWDLSLASDRPTLPTRRGGTIAPNNGVPLVLNGDRTASRF